MSQFTLIFFTLSTFAVAGEVRLSLETVPGYALQHNRTLVAARLQIDEARGRLHQAGRLANPEVELELNRNVRAPEGAVGLAITQKIPLTGRLRLEKAVTRAELAAAVAEVSNAERKIFAEVGETTVKLLALDGQRALRRIQLRNSRELASFTVKRLEVGEASLSDASLVELEAQQLQGEILQLDVERTVLISSLRLLLGVFVADELIIEGELSKIGGLPLPSADPVVRPDLVAANSVAEAARKSAALARSQKWEDIGVGLNVTEERSEDAPEGFERDTFVGLRLTIPWPLWNDNAGRVQESEAAALRAENESETLAFSIDVETSAARGTLAVLKKLLDSFDNVLLPRTLQIEEQLRSSYSTGQIPLTEVLRARDRRLLIQGQRLNALRDYHLARIRYLAAMGSSTVSKNISK